MNKKFNSIKKLTRSVMLLLTAFAMSTSAAYADGETTTPQIVIGGDVYGGGKEGVVGTALLAGGVGIDANADAIKMTQAAANAIESETSTDVTIYDGKIRTVFAGGRNGRVYGSTLATIDGGTIGGEEWEGTTHGGVFGAGDGAKAIVFGCGRVVVENGTVWNNVYGGGNQAELIGYSLVTLQGGRLYGNVFGGARMANIMTYAHVIIDGKNQKNDLYVKGVYGGSDISGAIQNMTRVQTNVGAGNWNWFMTMSQYAGKAMKANPDKAEWMEDISEAGSTPYAPTKHPNRAINVSQIWNTIVESTPKASDKDLFVGNTFGAGNGAYSYVGATGTNVSLTLPFHKKLVDGEWVADDTYKEDANGDVIPSTAEEYATASSSKTFINLMAPNVDRAYLQLEGGTFGYVYGGGNNTTVIHSADIYIKNPEDPCEIPAVEMERMGLQTTTYTLWDGEDSLSRLDYAKLENKSSVVAKVPQTFDRVFGGNNVAASGVAPNWYLIQGRVNNLYSGGNKGDMTADNGILVNVFKNDGPYDYDPIKYAELVAAGNSAEEAKAAAKYPVDAMKINNIYGGCRMADISPASSPVGYTKFGYEFFGGYAARVYISGGHINNVYGGNDVSGHVAYGTDVEIHGAISGDVYGGGNGAYPYTDNAQLAKDYPDEWGDYYYDANGGLDLEHPVASADASLGGLYKKRPHVENTLVHIAGEGKYLSPEEWQTKYGAYVKEGATVAKYVKNPDGTQKIIQLNPEGAGYNATEANAPGLLIAKGEMEDINRVYVLGGVYCGGNSATLNGDHAHATFQIGQCVTMDKIFLGSNGEKMVDVGLLTQYSQTIGGVKQDNNKTYKLAKFDLTDSGQMARYMEGCAMNIMPEITYDNPDRVFTNTGDADDYRKYKDEFYYPTPLQVDESRVGEEIDLSVDPNADMDSQGLNFSTHIGSFFCGGNVGSITVDGTIDEEAGLKFPRELVIFDKIVGGCNNANVPYRENINAFYQGGVTGEPGAPMAYQSNYAGTNKSATQYDDDPGLKIKLYVPCRLESRYLNKHEDENGFWWIDETEPEPFSAPIVISDYGIESDIVGPVQILDRGNIYGGCYQSGYVNGSVQIQIKDEICSSAQMRAYYGDTPFIGQNPGEDGVARVLDNMRRYIMTSGWSAYGGGYGKETEIWGNVYMDLTRNEGILNAFGGSKLGFIGKMKRYNEATTATEIKRDANTGLPVYNADGNYVTEEVNKVPGDYITNIAEFTTTTTTTTTTIKENVVKYDRYQFYEGEGGNTYINLGSDIHRSPITVFNSNAIYGGGYKGIVTGNTHVFAGGGMIYDVFGGACNADIYGSTEVFVGLDRFSNFINNLQYRHCVYGGNDFGGQILGTGTHVVYDPTNDGTKEVTSNTFVKYLGGNIERSIHGGSCGLYRYNEEYTLKKEDFDSDGKLKYKDFMIGGERVDAATIAALRKGDKIRLYPVGSWESMPTLFNNLKGTYNEETKTYDNPNSYNAVVDVACANEANVDVDHGKMPNRIFGNIYGGGYGFCDELGRVDMRDAYVLLHGPVAGTQILADNVFGGGYFSYVKNATVDAVSGRIRTGVYGGTYGTTVDAGVAAILNANNVAKAKTQTSTWGSNFNEEEYEVLTELDLTQLKNSDYTSENLLVNVWPLFTQNPGVNIYGAGGYTGGDNVVVNLYGGNVNEVYGGSNQEGVCKDVYVNVPKNSTISLAALYGGGHGSYEALPCDVRNAYIEFNSSSAVVRNGLIFGGNNAYRATHNAVTYYNARAKDKNGDYLSLFGAGNGIGSVAGNTHIFVADTAIVKNVYGGGQAGQVFNKYDILTKGTPPTQEVKNVIFDETGHLKPVPADDATNPTKAQYESAFNAYTAYHDASQYKRYRHDDPNHSVMSYAHWYETTPHWYDTDMKDIDHQTHIRLGNGTQVMGSVYGAGYGPTSTVSGHTLIDCNGATVVGDIFGGGYSGNVRKMQSFDTGYQAIDAEFTKEEGGKFYVPEKNVNGTIKKNTDGNIIYKEAKEEDYLDNYIVSTTINMNGGSVRNIFGGGYEGYVGGDNFTINTETGAVTSGTVTTAAYDMTAETTVNIGSSHSGVLIPDYKGTEPGNPGYIDTYEAPYGLITDENGKNPGEAGYINTYGKTFVETHAWGMPNVQFSVYGAGDRGAVYGSSNVTMYNGYIGYDYIPATTDPVSEEKYVERLKANDADTKNLMKEDGNLYGGGFGEMARVLSTDVTIYDGHIRNSLYGGGEMSAVGWGTVDKNDATNELELSSIEKAGSTFVEMYGGQVNADAFGGGRGYSYDNNGEMQYGKIFNTDGFVFGKTDINIYRGTIGTSETIKESNGAHGNVFGGGNVGYVYSGNGQKYKDADGYYYKVANVNAGYSEENFIKTNGNKSFTEDTRVNVQVYGQATAPVTIPYEIAYHPGFTVSNLIIDRFNKYFIERSESERKVHLYSSTDGITRGDEITSIEEAEALLDEDGRAKVHFFFVDEEEFVVGDYIPNEALNSLTNLSDKWSSINQDGITIRNAVFAGGNVSKGSDKVYAFANTVFGNSTAAIIDVYCRDLIDVGGDGLGGIYGDGNLTFVDGYRELNVTNYGTDYYALSGNIDFTKSEDVERYNALTDRQKDFYTTEYKCKSAIASYGVGDVITNEDLKKLSEAQEWTGDEWKTYFDRTAAIINEGRYLNTIQRADYCGLKGSRLVMKGAMDRALDEGEDIDYTPYTINRVGELSLNQNNKTMGSEYVRHGSYAGFYNVVKYLGSMSSDKNFVTGLSGSAAGTADVAQSSIRETNSTNENDTKDIQVNFEYTNGGTGESTVVGIDPVIKHLYKSSDPSTAVGAYTFFEWKVANHDKNNRNNGTSPNKIALASGVYLELVDGLNADGEKNYGPIIGVVELDLLNVAPGEGGGFVYAKNHHGMPHFDTAKSYASVLSDANYHLKTVRAYFYDDDDNAPALFNGVETSGNFVHSSKRIVDDCFPTSNSYKGAVGAKEPYAPAHYWYLRGDFYVYDQLVSAYTGQAATYSSNLNLPLDLNGKQNATLQLVNVLPGLYTAPEAAAFIDKEHSDSIQVIFDNVTKSFGHNDPVSYWDWHNMNPVDQGKFVLTTYVCNDTIEVGGHTYLPGEACLPSVYESLKDTYITNAEGYYVDAAGKVIEGLPVSTKSLSEEQQATLTAKGVKAQTFFSETNGVNNKNGFLLTLDLTNPNVWNDYYTCQDETAGTVGNRYTTSWIENATKGMSKEQKDAFINKFVKSATFTCNESGVYGQYSFVTGDVISKTIYDMEDAVEANLSTEQKTALQATLAKFEPAYITVDSCNITINSVEKIVLKGYPMSESDYNKITAISGQQDGVQITDKTVLVKPAYICVSTIEVADKDYRYLNQLVSETEYIEKYEGRSYNGKTLGDKFQPAYYCIGGEATGSDGGSWGGKYYEAGKVYQGEDVCNVIVDTENPTKDERKHFTFNYDALDLLVANYIPYYVGTDGQTDEAHVINELRNAGTALNANVKYYDSKTPDATDPLAQSLYRLVKPLDVDATFMATTDDNKIFSYKDSSISGGQIDMTKVGGQILDNEQFENLPNDRKYYVPFTPATGHVVNASFTESGKTYQPGDILNATEYSELTDNSNVSETTISYAYIVREGFDVGGKRYNAGQTIAASEFRKLEDGNKSYIDLVTDLGATADIYYYCIQEYKIGEKDAYVTPMGSNTGDFNSLSVTTTTHKSKIGTASETTIDGVEIANDNVVPLGAVIIKTQMEERVPNYQKNFSLSGTSPVEEATLYVPASASINNLLKDRYVTAIYEYRYSETNDGINYETFVEKHIVNILVKFLDGQPKIGPLTEPDLILPTENITMAIPIVEEGAFPVVGAGWEIFPTLAEAQKHKNGAKYDNGRQPLYWYQNGYYIAYYAETSRGRTYSAPVEIRVANYHKLSDVVNDANHLFIDHKDCDRNPKIYIDDKMINIKENTAVTAKNNVNELDALKTLFDLSITDYATKGGQIKGTGEDAEKVLLQNHGRDFSNCSNLEFIIHDNINQKDYSYTQTTTDEETGAEITETKTEARPWTAIGTSTNCFSGNVHGNGHTISGLEQSLFEYFCGHVYNLGVTGPFTGAGIANHGDGRAENCWVGSALQTPMGCKAVMGDDGADVNPAYVINCYYPDVNDFTPGTAKKRTAADFLNGQVAYDLNRFYLDARYLKHSSTKIENGGLTQENAALNRTSFDVKEKIENLEYTKNLGDYKIPTMYPLNYEETLSGVLENTSTDPANPNKENRGADCLLYNGYFKFSYYDSDNNIQTRDKKLGYVEHMYEDGDFRYAEGLKPKMADMRQISENVWLPIFPDDYIFFGQKLSYTLYDIEHGQHPTAAVKEKTIVEYSIVNNGHNGLLTSDGATTNRIYRAPAYFRNGVYGKSAIFNQTAAFTDKVTVAEAHTISGGEMGYSEGEIPFLNLAPKGDYYPHRNMTAIDFTGYKDNNWVRGNWSSGTMYEPLLDYYGLEDIKVNGLTQNLLVYIPDNDTKSGGGIDNDGINTKTATVVNGYFTDAAITEVNAKYRNVAISTPTLLGHVVQKKTDDGYVAHTDHRLIDRQDFNAPIEYTFDTGKRMWYQRKPEHGYANVNMGWDALCLPFEVELVTTQDKGEISHFSKGKSTGHEYWLREFTGKGEPKDAESDPTQYIAAFTAIEATTGNSHVKTYTNTFLYDYYYSKDAFDDKNLDKYQEQYYKEAKTYNNYPYGQAGTPYIAGFPGKTYYEFDLSGTWTPLHRKGDVTIASPGAQTITFASVKGATIAISDAELTSKAVTKEGYTYKPTYLMAEWSSIADNSYYEMNANGGSFDLVDSTATAPRTFQTVAFRPYFVKAKSSGAKEEMTRSIVFGEGNEKMNDKETDDDISRRINGMKIYVSNNKLVVESTYEADLNVNYISGAFARRIHVNQGTNVYEGLRPGFYIAGRTKVYIRPTAY